MESNPTEEAEVLKNLGNDAFKNNKFPEAIAHYTEAIGMNLFPTLSNLFL